MSVIADLHSASRTRLRGARYTAVPQVRPASPRSAQPIVCDLFSGAGVFSGAFVDEGFRVTQAVELDPIAAATYAAQIGDHVTVADVRTVEPTGRCDVLIAGPPCQGFSTLGKRLHNDPRNTLSWEVFRWAEQLLPRVVVVENVAAFIGTVHQERLVHGLESIGYQTDVIVVDAADFGVAQHRQRAFVFAAMGRLPTLETPGVTTSVRQAWQGLPSIPTGRNLHVAPKPSPIALARMKVTPVGGGRRDIVRTAPHLAPPSWKRLGADVADAWGRMAWDTPSNTLRTSFQNASKGRYIHPEQHRVITLREAARLHSIPDVWTFEGWSADIARQIGNSVPTLLGRAVARAVRDVL